MRKHGHAGARDDSYDAFADYFQFTCYHCGTAFGGDSRPSRNRDPGAAGHEDFESQVSEELIERLMPSGQPGKLFAS